MSIDCVSLEDMTNHPITLPMCSQATSPAIMDGSLSIPRQLRHKISSRVFAQNKDSSESVPSIHSSIYDARKWSSTEENTCFNDTLPAGMKAKDSIRVGQKLQRNNQKLGKPSISSRAPQSHWQYGSPLETIVEQRSFSSLRTTRSLEVDCQELQKSSTAKARKKKSLSFNDLHEIASIQKLPSLRQTSQPLFELVVYTDPSTPPYDPPRRSPTPPGLPSWSKSQAAYIQGPRPIPARQGPFWRRQALSNLWSSLFHSRLTSSTRSRRRAPRFRPPTSGHGTESGFQRHPFHQDVTPKLDIGTSSVPHISTAVPSESGSPQRPRVHFVESVQSRPTTELARNATPPIPCHHTRRRQQEDIPLLSLTNPRIQPSAETQALVEHLDTDHVHNRCCWKCVWDHTKETLCLLCCGHDDDNVTAEAEVDFATSCAGGRRVDRDGGYNVGI